MLANLPTVEETCHTECLRSREQFDRDRKTMPGGAKGAYFYKPYPLTMQRGEGCYLYDIDEHQLVVSLLNQGYFLSQGLTMNALSLPMQNEHIDGLIAAVDRAIRAYGKT